MTMYEERPPVAATTKGQPKTVEANGTPHLAHSDAAGKPLESAESASRANGRTDAAETAYLDSARRIWRYTGKRARVHGMLARMPHGETQMDTLPQHTRSGSSIHAMREDGLNISTELEGDYCHARYRLVTPGRLIIQAENRQEAA